MASFNKDKLFIKTKSFKSISVPILFILTFLLVIFNKTDYLVVNKIKSSGVEIINPITKVLFFPFEFSLNTISYYNELRFIQKENNKLKEELKRLKKWQILALKNTSENNAYKRLLNSTSNDIDIIKTASISQFLPNLYTQSILINAGFKDNIEKNNAVINERGLIGKTVMVTKNHSKVLLLTDQNLSVPIKSINNEFYAILKGSSNGKLLVSTFIKDNQKPLNGEILVTSGNAGIYPQNLLVGKIIAVDDNKIEVLPFVDFKNIEFVQIIKNN